MSAICQFNQFGHCKYGARCEKFHTIETCDNFPCVNRECDKRHPKLCQYFMVYGWCRFAGNCSFLHYNSSGFVHTSTSQGLQEIVQAMSELKNEIKTLRLEVDRLERQNQNLMESMRQLNSEKDTVHEDRQEIGDSIDDQEANVLFDESKVEDWCAILDNPTRDVTECYEMIIGLKQFAEFLSEDNSDDVATRFEMCGGLAKTKKLQSHTNEPIRQGPSNVLGLVIW